MTSGALMGLLSRKTPFKKTAEVSDDATFSGEDHLNVWRVGGGRDPTHLVNMLQNVSFGYSELLEPSATEYAQ